MKKLTTQLALILIAACLLQVSCKKDDAPVPADTLTLLQNKNWKLTAATESSVNGVIDVYHDVLEDCNRDDLFRFNPGGAFVLDEGPTKCDPGDVQSQPGTWSYTESTKTLHFTLNTVSDHYDIAITSITESTFAGKMVEVDAGITYTTTMSFARQ